MPKSKKKKEIKRVIPIKVNEKTVRGAIGQLNNLIEQLEGALKESEGCQ